MDRTVGILLALNIVLTSSAQIVLKAGMSNPYVLAQLSSGLKLSAVPAILTNWLVLTGLAVYFASAFIWLLILSKVEVSLAYPFVGVGFVLTMILAAMIHGDQLTGARVAGTLFIAVGVAVLARS
ncbi:MAG: hypothetical protein JJU27_14195 [Gammaproteobacteria bacterium]|nr:hypothetical protein [Gammaproteobacteria bacterium]